MQVDGHPVPAGIFDFALYFFHNAEELLASPHSNLFALSVEEARWLERHGYPTADELASLAVSDLAGLEETMRNRKDPKAAALVGHEARDDETVAECAVLGDEHLGSEIGEAVGQRVDVIRVDDETCFAVEYGFPREELPAARAYAESYDFVKPVASTVAAAGSDVNCGQIRSLDANLPPAAILPEVHSIDVTMCEPK